MNGLDWGVLVMVAVGMVLGFSRGFVAQLLSIAGLFVAYLIAFAFYDEVAPLVRSMLAFSGHETYQHYEFLAQELHLDTYVYNALAFAILLFGVKIAFSIAGRLFNLLASTPGLKQVNQWSGATLGILEAALIIIIIVHVMTVLPNDTAQRLLKHSIAAPYILENTPVFTNKLQELWENRADLVKAAVWLD
ncbi:MULTISPECIES: CvpA family protein [unclassified Paenibacillus]|uniref:CvpA family protein n=1 Tax=unclassified Paenibacillus TaxID=185978 RepID=UPI001AE244EB|nr:MULTISPECIES: CvpA family protein [unclassified Paenibacillus]MBP1156824.1 putative membrane protein required for colicin V production [Paenibacillus sp. PvP091]MBP1172437.1 putative membrane protein required for colicin V production [Paenibacillus sp. PvR098]MBP2438818.1 putative membrane protein required for colicin V production [Paenibacillus sp. PvP052]